jgi:hypothetical protein
VADDHDQHTQADRPTPGDSDTLERLLRADGSAWRAWVQPSVERLEARIHAKSASDSLWARLATRLEPRDPMDATQEAMDGYHVSPMLREIELEDIVGTDSDTDRQLHTIRSTRLDADWTRGRRRLVAILASVAAVLLLAALVGVLLAQQGRTPTAGVPTVIQRGQLTWQRVSLPDVDVSVSISISISEAGLYPSPSDGNTAYFCATFPNKPSPHPRLWVTHDRALHWSRLADVPTTRDATRCDLGVDRLDPRVLTVTAYPLDANGVIQPEQWQQFVSVDGGTTWSSYTDVGSIFGIGQHDHATWQGKTYAVRYLPPIPQSGRSRLYVSEDQMRTWTEIDGPILSSPAMRALPAEAQAILTFQVHPSTGELLVEDDYGQFFWDSRDGGAHWTQLAISIQLPASQSAQGSQYGIAQEILAPPEAGQPWHICVLGNPVPSPAYAAPTLPFACASDGGTTWQTRLGLFFSGGSPPIGMLADGTVFREDTVPAEYKLRISRLPPNATSEREWVQLGDFPFPIHDRKASCRGGGIDGIYGGNRVVAPSGGVAYWISCTGGARYTTVLR